MKASQGGRSFHIHGVGRAVWSEEVPSSSQAQQIAGGQGMGGSKWS